MPEPGSEDDDFSDDQSEYSRLEDELASVNLNIKKQKEENLILKTEISRLNTAITSESESLKERITIAEQERAESEASRKELLDELEYVKNVNKDDEKERKAEVAALNATIISLEKRLENEGKDNAGRLLELTSLKKRVEGLEKNLEEANQTTNQEAVEKRDREAEVMKLTTTIDDLLHEKSKLNEEMNGLKMRVEELMMKLENAKPDKEAEVGETRDDDGLRSRLEELSKELDQARDDYTILNEQRKTEVADLITKSDEMTKELGKATMKITQLEEKKSCLQDQLDGYMINFNCGGNEEETKRSELSTDPDQQVEHLNAELKRITMLNKKIDDERVTDFISLSIRLADVASESELFKELNMRLVDQCELETKKAEDLELKLAEADKARISTLIAHTMETKAKKSQETTARTRELEQEVEGAKQTIKSLNEDLDSMIAKFEESKEKNGKAQQELQINLMQYAGLKREHASCSPVLESLKNDLAEAQKTIVELKSELDKVRLTMQSMKERSEDEEGVRSVNKTMVKKQETPSKCSPSVLQPLSDTKPPKIKNEESATRMSQMGACLTTSPEMANGQLSREMLEEKHKRLNGHIGWNDDSWTHNKVEAGGGGKFNSKDEKKPSFLPYRFPSTRSTPRSRHFQMERMWKDETISLPPLPTLPPLPPLDSSYGPRSIVGPPYRPALLAPPPRPAHMMPWHPLAPSFFNPNVPPPPFTDPRTGRLRIPIRKPNTPLPPPPTPSKPKWKK